MNFDQLDKKIPPPVVALLAGLFIWLTAKVAPSLSVPDTLRYIATFVFWLLSTLVSAPAVVSMKKQDTTLSPLSPEKSSALVSSGVYRFTRNPMYLGLALLLLAWSAWLASPWGVIWVGVFVVYIQRFQILPEERALTESFGEEFGHYCRQVRRWI